MKPKRSSKAPEWMYVTGACFFIVVLAVSAVWDRSIRWLHFFQAWMYVATIILGLRKDRWGYFIGITAAGMWMYVSLFGSTFFFSGLEELSHWIHTGRLKRPDQLIALPAWFSNLFVVLGCLWAYLRLPAKSVLDVARLGIALVLTSGFFALDMAIFQPRYLPLFRSIVHPHWRWR
jgi:hypothetical protein